MAGPAPLSDDVIKEKMAQFDNVPLFMQTLPDDDNMDPTLAALQNLAHEGTPDENALNFKDQGNDYFKGKRYREALGFYTQGIDAKPTEAPLIEALLCNRAACNLELENYGSVLRDCSKALTLNPKSSKAFYRSALALVALERYDEALDCCTRCLSFDAGNKGIQTVVGKAETLLAAKTKKEAARQERLRIEQEAKRQLTLAYRQRHLLIVPNPEGGANPYSPHWDTEQQDTLIFPVFFLYPQYATSDVIPEFVEDTPFAEHMRIMFPPGAPPPEWDVNGEYVDGRLAIYAMTRARRLLKVGKKMSLRDVCIAGKAKDGMPRDGLELKDGCLTFVILPKGDVEKKWIEEFKSSKS